LAVGAGAAQVHRQDPNKVSDDAKHKRKAKEMLEMIRDR
jgi:hypothetical protein